jgi:hypothetical protein
VPKQVAVGQTVPITIRYRGIAEKTTLCCNATWNKKAGGWAGFMSAGAPYPTVQGDGEHTFKLFIKEKGETLDSISLDIFLSKAKEIAQTYEEIVDVLYDPNLTEDGCFFALRDGLGEAQIKEEQTIEMCVEAPIRYQPFARDLRSITVAMKVAYDLSRICRYHRNISEVMEEFNIRCDEPALLELYREGYGMVRRMVRSAR